MSKKMLVVPMPLSLHTKFKWHAGREGVAMSRIVRMLIAEYLAGEVKVDPDADPTPPPGRPNRYEPETDDVLEALYEEISRVVD